LRFGVGRPPGRQDPAEFVLAPFPSAVAAELATLIARAADAAECLLIDGLEVAQNRFNS
jgi:peptidyl-tRNA hydrolase, PTH1 family